MGSQTGMLANSRHHARANLITIMECEDEIRRSRSLQNPVRSRLSFDGPAAAQQSSKDTLCLCR